ncbi:MAG: hypothetical protein OXD31_18365 [Chloroflexi bacterium]|nr:hypothetical protein [Chloroflexota bacterium]
MNTRDIDNRVTGAFDELVNEASRSRLLGEIAFQPYGRHEKTIEDLFRTALRSQFGERVRIPSNQTKEHYNKLHDIVVLHNSVTLAKFEVKTPFTDTPGIRGKTRKPEHLPKDMNALKAALETGASSAYALITPIGCYPVDPNVTMTVLNSRSLKKNEEAIKAKYQIQWPTRPDYETNPLHGKQEVDRAMKQLADERRLKVKRVKGWQKVVLPKPKPNIYTFIDCALYKVQLK